MQDGFGIVQHTTVFQSEVYCILLMSKYRQSWTSLTFARSETRNALASCFGQTCNDKQGLIFRRSGNKSNRNARKFGRSEAKGICLGSETFLRIPLQNSLFHWEFLQDSNVICEVNTYVCAPASDQVKIQPQPQTPQDHKKWLIVNRRRPGREVRLQINPGDLIW